MSNLEKLKQKMMIKPKVEEREKVAVVIKRVNNVSKKGNLSIHMNEQDDINKEDEEHDGNEDEERRKGVELNAPIIVDETSKGFDRKTLLDKLKQSKLIKVSMKPVLEKINEKIESVSKKPEEKIKKAKKVTLTKGTINKEKETKQAINKGKLLVIEEDDDEDVDQDKELERKDEEEIIIKPKKTNNRMTEKIKKGVAILGPEVMVQIGDTNLTERIPIRKPPINIKVSSYYMNNREIFVNFINSLFEPYRREIQNNKENISCDAIGKTNTNFDLLTHQKIVRDYMNMYTPYRGLLLYHGLGSGKTATSIAIAEGMKDSKRVIIMTPASLRANYVEELKKAGDLLYKRNQFWEWISTDANPETAEPMSSILNLPLEYIQKYHGAWFINVKKKSNYEELSDIDRKTLDDQLNEMIKTKYTFINYNGLRTKRLEELTSGFTRNLFDDSVVIIDEAHNLISRIVNKIKKEKPIEENERGEKEHLPISLSVKLYEFLLSAKNARIILLSGTPIINYPNEFGILFNILRGYIKTWKIPLNVKTNKKIDQKSLQEMLLGEKTFDYIDYSASSKILTITRNPFGFKNKIKKDSGYQGVANTKKDEKGNTTFENEFTNDEEFEKNIMRILKRNDIDVLSNGIKVENKKSLPDKLELFYNRYIDENTGNLKNVDALQRRIIGLSSYFKSAQENLLPKYNKILGVDYHIVRIPMSNFQFKIYESARHEERKSEKPKKQNKGDELKEMSSTYRIFSRLFCNFVIPNRPMPKEVRLEISGLKEEKEEEKKEKKDSNVSQLQDILKEASKLENKEDLSEDREGEIEGDELLDKIGGETYKARIEDAIRYLKDNSNDFLTPEALQTYSPKFLHMLENIKDPEYIGLHLVYSQFRTLEGIGVFTLVLDKNGFTQFKIKKNTANIWQIDISPENKGKPTYALYTGTETSEEKEIIRNIYNGDWDLVPDTISSELQKISKNNNMGEIIKILMITSSGSEGINLRNTRYVHIMEPYWHPVRLEQVIGRARRICSHKNLPEALQTVEVFIYIMTFTEEQLKSDHSIELKNKDLSRLTPRVPLTSDQNLYEISEIKANLTSQLTQAIKESAFDCYIYSNGKCVNFGEPTNNKFSYVPDYAEQQNDTTVRANKVAIEWVGKPVTINGNEYVYRRISKSLLNIYDKASYEAALKDSSIIPLQIGTLETNEKGQQVFKQIG
jgi:hypothetical protein